MLFFTPKKTDRADLEKQKPLIFSISLLITMIIVITAFEYRTYDAPKKDLTVRTEQAIEEIMEVPPTEQLPPPPPIVQQPQIVEVANEEEIKEEIKVEFDMEVTQQTKSQDFTVYEQPVVEKEVAEEIFIIVEETAVPKGGMAGFYKYVNENLKYPAQARRMNIEGKVFIEFVVDKNGSITDVKTVKGIGAGCDEEAMRVIQNSPPWTPGKQRGRPVKQRLVLPIIFKIAGLS